MNGFMSRWNRLNYWLGFVSVIAICTAITAQVMYRYGFNGTFKWVDEFCQMLVILITFFGVGQVEQNDEQIKMELVFSIFPKQRFYIEVFYKFLTLVFIGILAYSEKTFLPSVVGIKLKASGIPVIFVHYGIVYGIAVWFVSTLYSIQMMFRAHKEERKRLHDEEVGR